MDWSPLPPHHHHEVWVFCLSWTSVNPFLRDGKLHGNWSFSCYQEPMRIETCRSADQNIFPLHSSFSPYDIICTGSLEVAFLLKCQLWSHTFQTFPLLPMPASGWSDKLQSYTLVKYSLFSKSIPPHHPIQTLNNWSCCDLCNRITLLQTGFKPLHEIVSCVGHLSE